MGLSDEIDKELVRRWVENKDSRAATEIYCKYNAEVFSFVTMLTRNYHISEEITHDVFLCLIESPQNFLKVDNLLGYFIRIAQNKINRIIPSIGLEVSIDLYESQIEETDNVKDPFDEYISNNNADIILEAMEKLKPNYKIALYLDIRFGYTNKEIADIMGIDIKATKNLLYRGKEIIKQAVQTKLGI